MSNKEVIVWVSLGEKLWFHVKGHKESASFEYDKKWLDHPERFALEPALKLTEGSFLTGQGLSLFGGFGDSAPDRWGRVLMRRFEAAKAKEQNRLPVTFFEIDYLLGVNDEARQGALRFSITPDENIFLAPKKKISTPPLVDLPKLLSATERFIADHESTEDLRLLLAPGSSLGGARPKASPRNYFRVSAMSMLGAYDNEQHSYLEMAYALAKNGASPEEDMQELWRRIVFTILVSNTDDHLRNHGFIYERYKGWRLSPAYDINPTPLEIAPHILTTSIDFDDNTTSLETAMRVAKEFRLKKDEALLIIKEVASSVKQWRQVAAKFGLSKQECDRMSSAFVYEESDAIYHK